MWGLVHVHEMSRVRKLQGFKLDLVFGAENHLKNKAWVTGKALSAKPGGLDFIPRILTLSGCPQTSTLVLSILCPLPTHINK